LDDLAAAQRRLHQKTIDLQEKLEALKSQATEDGRRKARRRLRNLAREFVSRHIDPNDVKVLFDPVRFIAFSGLSVETVKSVCFLDRPATSRRQERIQQSLQRSLARGNIEWVTLRVTDDGTVVRE
jgi:predicted Holliday junction resolvase-like endonuclease